MVFKYYTLAGLSTSDCNCIFPYMYTYTCSVTGGNITVWSVTTPSDCKFNIVIPSHDRRGRPFISRDCNLYTGAVISRNDSHYTSHLYMNVYHPSLSNGSIIECHVYDDETNGVPIYSTSTTLLITSYPYDYTYNCSIIESDESFTEWRITTSNGYCLCSILFSHSTTSESSVRSCNYNYCWWRLVRRPLPISARIDINRHSHNYTSYLHIYNILGSPYLSGSTVECRAGSHAYYDSRLVYSTTLPILSKSKQ